eukprot:Trichotokara_eunicae@DN4337_c0_g1_i6.p2
MRTEDVEELGETVRKKFEGNDLEEGEIDEKTTQRKRKVLHKYFGKSAVRRVTIEDVIGTKGEEIEKKIEQQEIEKEIEQQKIEKKLEEKNKIKSDAADEDEDEDEDEISFKNEKTKKKKKKKKVLCVD